MTKNLPAATIAAMALLALPASGQEFHVTEEQAGKLFAGKAYSPYANRSFPNRVFWGDSHLHTGLSLDAGLFGNDLGLDEAYRLARGEQIKASSGLPSSRRRFPRRYSRAATISVLKRNYFISGGFRPERVHIKGPKMVENGAGNGQKKPSGALWLADG